MTRDQALTATLDELRDALAEMDGWRFDPPEPCVPGGWWRWKTVNRSTIRVWRKDHPHPPTLPTPVPHKRPFTNLPGPPRQAQKGQHEPMRVDAGEISVFSSE